LGVPLGQTWQDVPQWEGLDWTSTHVPAHRLWLLLAHVVAQPTVPSVRQPKAQLIIVAGPQTPAPLQTRPVVRVLFEHEAEPHEVVLPGKTQAFRFCVVPSQNPAQVPLTAQALLGVVTGMQLPTLPATLQDSHWPSHGLSQQCP
jgi:hypothetical protein